MIQVWRTHDDPGVARVQKNDLRPLRICDRGNYVQTLRWMGLLL